MDAYRWVARRQIFYINFSNKITGQICFWFQYQHKEEEQTLVMMIVQKF